MEFLSGSRMTHETRLVRSVQLFLTLESMLLLLSCCWCFTCLPRCPWNSWSCHLMYPPVPVYWSVWGRDDGNNWSNVQNAGTRGSRGCTGVLRLCWVIDEVCAALWSHTPGGESSCCHGFTAILPACLMRVPAWWTGREFWETLTPPSMTFSQKEGWGRFKAFLIMT